MLAAKWKVASQAAAEEVFGDFSARVRENGGMKVLRKRQVECMAFDDVEERGGDGEEEEWRDEMGEVLTVREKEVRREEKMGRGKRVRGHVEEDEGEEEEELTVASMLAVLNIPLETIGWDIKKQGWES